MTSDNSSTTVRASAAAGRDSVNCRSSIFVGRMLFLACLVSVAAVLSSVSFWGVNGSQKNLAETQYESIVERALKQVVDNAARKQAGTRTVATVVGQIHRNASEYPFVTLPGFELIATDILKTSGNKELGFVPLVRQDQRQAFEDFAYDHFSTQFPSNPKAGLSPGFGQGIWTTNSTGGRERIVSADAYLDDLRTIPSRYNYFTPILQHDGGPHPVLMLNIRSEPARARQMEDMLYCVEQRASNKDASWCGAITDIVWLRGVPPGTGPGAVVLEPIYPASDPYTMTAILASPVVWDEDLNDVFSEKVSGIDVVLETETTQFSYRINNGKVEQVGFRDFHNSKYDSFRRSARINADQYTKNSPTYTIHMYPNDQLYASYNSFDPWFAALGALGILVATSIIFILYDSCVRHDLDSKNEMLQTTRSFVRYISHEVRTPLNSVFVGLSLMQEKQAAAAGFERAEDMAKRIEEWEDFNNQASDGLNSSQRVLQSQEIEDFMFVQELLNNAQSSVEVLSDFLNYDKIEAGNLKLELSVVDMNPLVTSVAREFRQTASKKEIHYEVVIEEPAINFKDDSADLEHDTPALRNNAVVGDKVRLCHVLRNLISNACKFTSKDGEVSIIVDHLGPAATMQERTDVFKMQNGEMRSFVGNGSRLRIQVIDTGAGMTPEQLQRVFSANVQFNPNTLQAGHGSGLGLFIAKGIVEQHSGTLTVTSTGLNEGSTFTIVLPLYAITMDVVEVEKDQSQPAEAISNQDEICNPHHILVVDDAMMNRKMMSRLLEHHGHTCDQAENGAVAVHKVQQAKESGKPFDTVLMDYEMPVMNGPDATLKIREDGNDGFIVGVTGNMFQEDIDTFVRSGANGVLSKPFKMEALDSLWAEYNQNDPDPGLGNSSFQI